MLSAKTFSYFTSDKINVSKKIQKGCGYLDKLIYALAMVLLIIITLGVKKLLSVDNRMEVIEFQDPDTNVLYIAFVTKGGGISVTPKFDADGKIIVGDEKSKVVKKVNP